MLAKTFKGGRTLSGAKATIKYLLNERVSQGTSKVLEGNPELTLAYIKQADKNAWSWSSGVLTFEETLTAEQEKDVMIEFKKMMFPGMKPDQYNILFVGHSDKGRTELHYIIPRIELTTGKAFNPYYVKKDFLKKDLFQDFINLKYGLSSHKDNPQVLIKKPKWTKKAKVADIRKEIDKALLPRVEQGIIQNRSELIYQLQEWGYELNRTGVESISIIDENNKKIKLKGAIYSQGFDNGLKGIREEATRKQNTTISGARRTLSSVRRELDRNIQQQAIYNAERYQRVKKEAGNTQKSNTKTKKADREIAKHEDEQIILKKEENDSTGTEAIRRIRAIREATSRRTKATAERINSSKNRVNSYTNTEQQDFTSIAERRRSDKLRRSVKSSIGTAFHDLITNFKDRVTELVKEAIAKKNEYIQPEIKTVLDHSDDLSQQGHGHSL